jgi:hypothetical protein
MKSALSNESNSRDFFSFEIIDISEAEYVPRGRKPGPRFNKKPTKRDLRNRQAEHLCQSICNSCGQQIRDGGKCGCS